jgi:hypothetical protein
MMNLSKSLLALAVITASSWPHLVTEAVEASPFPFTVTQPDGSQVTLFVRGNEYVNFFADPSGFPVVKSMLHDDKDDTVHVGADNSAFVYATLNSDGSLSSTEHQVGRVDPTRVPGLVPYVAPIVNVDEHFLAADQSEVTALPGVTGTRNDVLTPYQPFGFLHICNPFMLAMSCCNVLTLHVLRFKGFGRRHASMQSRKRRTFTSGTVKNLVLMIRWSDCPYSPKSAYTPAGLPNVQVRTQSCKH